MKGLILLCMIIGTAYGDDEETPKTDYGALSNSLQFLSKKWVDEPKQRDNIPAPNYRANPAFPNPLGLPVPTCQIVPVYSTIPPIEVIDYKKVCF